MTPDRADDWFEQLYASAGEDFERIPWAHLAPRPGLVRWLDRNPPAPATPALVIACGLGDDAEELARRGCEVEAFDLSPTAIATARRRFPGTRVAYRVADLFDLPREWRRRFGIVVEVQTVQSIPPEHHRAAILAIAETVATHGRLLIRAATRAEHEPAPSRPWPLAPSEIAAFADEGLEQRCSRRDGLFVEMDWRRPPDPG